MAENLSALELVPRGVEGTGKATILGNEQTLNSLARLSGRLDNLAKLRAYSAAKVAAAKQAKPTEPKMYTDVNQYVPEGVFGPDVARDNEYDDREMLNRWGAMNQLEQFQEAKIAGAQKAFRQAWSKQQDAGLTATKEELKNYGINFSNDDVNTTRTEYKNLAMDGAKKQAYLNSTTDPKQFNNYRRTIFYGGDIGSMFREKMLSDVGKYDLQKFGKSILDNVGTTSVQNIGQSGTGSTFKRDNIFQKITTTSGDQIELNVPLVAAVARKNPISAQMFSNLTEKYLVPATNLYSGTGAKEQQDAANAFAQNNFDLTKLTDDQKKLIKEEVIPRAESLVAQTIMNGVGDWSVVYDNDARKKGTSVSVSTGSEDKDKVSTGPVNVTSFGASYDPTKKREVLKSDGSPYAVDMGSLNLGSGSTKVLQSGNYPISSGTRFYYSGAIKNDLLKYIATSNPDGSWSLKVTPKTNTITVMHDPISISTSKNPIQFKIPRSDKSGISIGYYKPGTIVKSGSGVDSFNKDGDEYGMIDAQSILDALSDAKKQQELKNNGFTNLRFFIKLDDSPGIKTLLEGAYGNIGGKPSTTSVGKVK